MRQCKMSVHLNGRPGCQAGAQANRILWFYALTGVLSRVWLPLASWSRNLTASRVQQDGLEGEGGKKESSTESSSHIANPQPAATPLPMKPIHNLCLAFLTHIRQ